MQKVEHYEVKYKTEPESGDNIAILYKNGIPMHTVNVDHLIWEHFYGNGWIK